MAIRLPTVANIDYFDPNKIAEALVWSSISSQVRPQMLLQPDIEYYGSALTGDFTDSGLSVNHQRETTVSLAAHTYRMAGLVVPGPSTERNNLPLTYGLNMSCFLHLGVNDRIPLVVPVVASVKTFSPTSVQNSVTVKGLTPLSSYHTVNQTSDCTAYNKCFTQLTYNTLGNLTRVFIGYLIYNPWGSSRSIDDVFGSISVNALHHLREIFDPNLG